MNDQTAEGVAAEIGRASIRVMPIEPPDPNSAQRVIIALVTVMLLFFSIFFYGINVAIGVVEEKSSRVVELLLSTIKPIDLLVGKVLGIGLVGLIQLVVVGGVALITGLITGVITVTGDVTVLFAASLVWYVIGFAFFALLYAAAGSLVSRQEDVNSAVTPLMIVGFLTYFAGQFAISSPDSPIVAVLAWVPPFSATVMPVRVAQGEADLLQVLATMGIMVVACVIVAVLAARIYQKSILHTGTQQSVSRALIRV